jgi:hypothetical protein
VKYNVVSGAIGSAILECFATHTADEVDHATDFQMTQLVPSELPGSASPQEQLEANGISAKHIINAVNVLIG